MQEPVLLKISLVASFAGLAGMFFIAGNANIDSVPAADITPDDVGRSIKVCGSVERKFISRNRHVFFDITDESGSLKVVVFNSTKAAVDSERVCVTGRVNLYKGRLEIIADGVKNA
jgi:DNA/RNA endonuclease YhcR with UshA esterase domain